MTSGQKVAPEDIRYRFAFREVAGAVLTRGFGSGHHHKTTSSTFK